MTSCQTFYCTNENGKCEKNTGKYDSIGDKKKGKKNMCTHKTS